MNWPGELKLSAFCQGHAKCLEHQGFVVFRGERACRVLRHRLVAGVLLRGGVRHSHGAAPHEVHKAFLVQLDEAYGRSLFATLRIFESMVICTLSLNAIFTLQEHPFEKGDGTCRGFRSG